MPFESKHNSATGALTRLLQGWSAAFTPRGLPSQAIYCKTYLIFLQALNRDNTRMSQKFGNILVM